jgi:hypothetical protein
MQNKKLGLCESGAKAMTLSKTSSRDLQENMMGPHGAAPQGSNQSMASGLNRFEEEKVMKLDRQVSQTSQVSTQP